MEKLYLDANVFSHIAERTAGIDETQVARFESALSNRFVIPLSLIVLDEALVISRSDQDKARLILDYVAKTCDLNLVLKPADQILREEIEGLLNGGSDTVSPFFDREDEVVTTIRSAVNGTDPIEDLDEIAEMIDSQKGDFYDSMAEGNESTRKELGIMRGKKLPKFEEGRPPTFSEFLERIAPGFAEGAASRIASIDEIRAVGVDRFLTLSSVNAFSGIAASWTYSQIIEHRKLERSSGYDMNHAVVASAADRIITNDREFRRLMERLPLLGPKVRGFAELSQELEQSESP